MSESLRGPAAAGGLWFARNERRVLRWIPYVKETSAASSDAPLIIDFMPTVPAL